MQRVINFDDESIEMDDVIVGEFEECGPVPAMATEMLGGRPYVFLDPVAEEFNDGAYIERAPAQTDSTNSESTTSTLPTQSQSFHKDDEKHQKMCT
ncbi:hypothetical protein AAF712_013043 [Marasmius tenuissimus]|uniref:Uncharacterized protein n=1 Tax=Marasmius tenuissimus TaxID=585030 RepID=A0ABR2ZGY4_9AGAR